MASPSLQPNLPQPIAQADILPTLFGKGYGNYDVQPNNFLYSFLTHIVIGVLIIVIPILLAKNPEPKIQAISVFTELSPYVLPASPKVVGGGGGGDEHLKVEASKGALPRLAQMQITPPTTHIENIDPKLAVAPTVVMPPIPMPQMPLLGDPKSAQTMMASNGTGGGAGIGSGSGTGVGMGYGPGVGDGRGGGIGGGLYKVGGGVSAPRPLYDPEPEYSEEARKAKYQGTVVVRCVVGPDGRVRDIQLPRTLGMGLDEKVIEKVKTWKFEPAKKDGQAVAVMIAVEVNFHLY
ncbi:MAG: energy transducer TonB [Terriglobales bacterium]